MVRKSAKITLKIDEKFYLDRFKDFIIPFSCKRRGICPSCNTRAMVETAAHLVENLIPCVSNRQWVISFPLRIRHFLQTPKILQDVLKIVVDEIRKRLIACSPDVSHPQIGAVSFIQNFGNTLNVHPHFHVIVADGLFCDDNADLKFYEACLTLDDIADTQDAIQKRVLKFFYRRGATKNLPIRCWRIKKVAFL